MDEQILAVVIRLNKTIAFRGVEMIEPTERMPSVSLLAVLPAETVNTILTALMSAEGALDLMYRRTSIETYGHAPAQVRVALNDFADLLA